MQRRSLIHGLGAAAVASAGAPLLAQTSAGKIVLGQSCALTGPAAQLGIQFQRGAKLYFDRVNAKGGVNGKTIELVTVDDGYEPDRCKVNTEKLIKDDVFALFGYIGTPTSLAALPMATAAKVPFLFPFTGAQGLRDPFNRYAFHVRASYFDETAKIVNQLFTVGMKKIAVFYQNDSYGQAGLTGVQRALTALQSKPVATGTVERNTVDVAASVKGDRAGAPRGHRADQRLQELRGVHPRGAQGRLRRPVLQRLVRRHAGAGQRVGPGRARRGGQPGDAVSVRAVSACRASTCRRSSAVKEVEPNYSTIEGYVAAKVFIEGMKRTAAPANRDAFVAGLESLHDFDLGGFFVDFNARKHTGSAFVDMTILTQDGKVRR